MAARALLVYAVCRRPCGRIALAGIAREPLAVVEAAGLAAITGELARPPRVTVAALRRYEGVLRELSEALPAVLPARFGTCMGGVEELAFVLRSRDASLLAAVARWVRAERVERSGDIASVYHLIPRGAVDAYVRAALGAAQAEGVRVVVTGPFPAYAFGGW